jgi:hypothetical protein
MRNTVYNKNKWKSWNSHQKLKQTKPEKSVFSKTGLILRVLKMFLWAILCTIW